MTAENGIIWSDVIMSAEDGIIWSDVIMSAEGGARSDSLE